MTEHVDQRATGRRHLVSQRLRARRLALGLTQQQVVTRLGRRGTRTSNRALSGFERGAGLDVGKLPELAAALDCSVTYLLGLTDDPRRWKPDAQHWNGGSSRPTPQVEQPRARALAVNAPARILGPDVPDLVGRTSSGA